MRFSSVTFFSGAILGAAVAGSLGYNHGRGAPILTNPLEEYTLTDRTHQALDTLLDKAHRRIKELEHNLDEAMKNEERR